MEMIRIETRCSHCDRVLTTAQGVRLESANFSSVRPTRPATSTTINGQDVSNGCYSSEYRRWVDDGPEGYIHYLDGRIVPVEHISK